ncbi:MAG: hypothetical protein ACYDIA_16070 [Candidatus Humimicrobiaceae bacterium]
MTVSLSSMLFAYCLMLTKTFGGKEMLNEFKYLMDYLNENIYNLFNGIESCLDKNNFGSYFILGVDLVMVWL